MERVEATELARRRLTESRVSLWVGWWRAIAEEPAALIALTLAPILLVLAAVWPETASKLASRVGDAAVTWVALASSGAASSASVMPGLGPVTRTVVDAVTLPVLLASFFFGLQQVGEGLFAGGSDSETSARRAQSESTSRRNPS